MFTFLKYVLNCILSSIHYLLFLFQFCGTEIHKLTLFLSTFEIFPFPSIFFHLLNWTIFTYICKVKGILKGISHSLNSNFPFRKLMFVLPSSYLATIAFHFCSSTTNVNVHKWTTLDCYCASGLRYHEHSLKYFIFVYYFAFKFWNI